MVLELATELARAALGIAGDAAWAVVTLGEGRPVRGDVAVASDAPSAAREAAANLVDEQGPAPPAVHAFRWTRQGSSGTLFVHAGEGLDDGERAGLRALANVGALALQLQGSAPAPTGREAGALDEALRRASHDLRTPLASALLWLTVLRGGGSTEPSPVDAIERSIVEMQAILERLNLARRTPDGG